MPGNISKLDIVNVDVHTKVGQILSIHSQDIEWKTNIHGMMERLNDGKTVGQGESSIAWLWKSGAIISRWSKNGRIPFKKHLVHPQAELCLSRTVSSHNRLIIQHI